jgi:hypothetical protein
VRSSELKMSGVLVVITTRTERVSRHTKVVVTTRQKESRKRQEQVVLTTTKLETVRHLAAR